MTVAHVALGALSLVSVHSMPIQKHVAVAKSNAVAISHMGWRLGLYDTASYVFKTHVNMHKGLPGLKTLFECGVFSAGTRIW